METDNAQDLENGVTEQQPADDPAKPKSYDAAYVARLKAQNNQRRNRIRELEAKLASGNAQAEAQSETEWKARAERAEAELNAMRTERERETMAARIAKEVGLPIELAARLRGEDEDEMRDDAEALKSLIPAPASTQTPAYKGQPSKTSPAPSGAPVGRTEDDLRREYFGGGRASLPQQSSGGADGDGRFVFGGR